MIDNWHAMEESGNYRKVSPLAVQMSMPNGPAGIVGLNVGARAGVITRSRRARRVPRRLHAWRHIVLGDADMVVCGGVENLHRRDPDRGVQHDAGHEHAQRRSAGRFAPVRQGSRRFVFGEAAAMLILEREEHARGARAHPRPRPRCRHHLRRIPPGCPRPHRSGNNSRPWPAQSRPPG